MSIPSNIRDRTHRSYVQSPSRAITDTAIEVFVGNQGSSPVPTIEGGTGKVSYNESVVAALSTVTLINFTITQNSNLKNLLVSSENVGVFTLEVNDTELIKLRTYFTAYTLSQSLGDISLGNGDNIKIKFENKRSSICSANATLIYKEI